MKTFAKAITSRSIPRLREPRLCSHSISSEPSGAQGGEEERSAHSALNHSWTPRDLCVRKREEKKNASDFHSRGWNRGWLQMLKPGKRLHFPGTLCSCLLYPMPTGSTLAFRHSSDTSPEGASGCMGTRSNLSPCPLPMHSTTCPGCTSSRQVSLSPPGRSNVSTVPL